jgi:hypothetical protein
MSKHLPHDAHAFTDKEEYVALQIIGRLLLITKPIWS